MQIHQSTLTPGLTNKIFEEFSKAAIKATGIDGLSEKAIPFEIRKGENLIGCIVVQMFWGQLHIKYLFVQEQYRLQGIATKLMEHAFEFAKSRGCTFAFVETMNFQALGFYQKLGFKVELSRYGYDKDTSFHYLKVNLTNAKPQVVIRPLIEADISVIPSQFAKYNWPKSPSTFEMYFKEQQMNERLVWVAYTKYGHPELDSGSKKMRNQVQHDNEVFTGYITLKWQSRYEPFRIKNIPEIMDLNVLPPFQGQGIGSTLLKTAEDEAFKKSHTVGIGVGLYADYGNAQKLYIKRGYVPDRNGITYNYQPVKPGTNAPVDDDLILWLTQKNLKK
jgi:ribosomal protein S18 acetylase RimI-like enzyme